MNGQNRLLYLIKRMVYRYFVDGIPQAAAELAYFLLFSMFPMLMFLNSILTRLDISVDSLLPFLEMLPQSLKNLIVSYFAYINGLPSISPMIIGISLTLYFLSRAVRSMMRTVSNIYHVEVQRSMAMGVLISFGLTMGFLVSVVLSFVLVVFGKTILRLLTEYLPIPQAVLDFTQNISNASYWLLIVFMFGFLLLFNRIVPNIRLRFREVWPGALFSLAAWLLVSWAFSFYVDHIARYSLLYGSLGTIMVLMLWLYLVSMILLMGPQLNHTLTVMRLYRIETGKGH